MQLLFLCYECVYQVGTNWDMSWIWRYISVIIQEGCGHFILVSGYFVVGVSISFGGMVFLWGGLFIFMGVCFMGGVHFMGRCIFFVGVV